LVIFRVYVNLPEGNILIQSLLLVIQRWQWTQQALELSDQDLEIFWKANVWTSGQKMWAKLPDSDGAPQLQTGYSSNYRENIHHKP
jgi:hypothetical protein